MLRYLIGFSFFFFQFNYCQEKISLWAYGVPNQKKSDKIEKIIETEIIRIENVQNPTLEIYLPSRNIRTDQAVIIFPGGGYEFLAYDWEGTDFAKGLNAKGISAFVLKYRLPTSPSIVDPKLAPLQDAQRAVRLVKANAREWGINTQKIGVLGFSAGGHLASTLATKFNKKTLKNSFDEIDSISARPSFVALIYPVITFDEKYRHEGSKNALIGKSDDKTLISMFSNNLHVNSETPPCFLIHSADDKAVPVQNSMLFYNALIENGISAEMHLFPFGGHGFALAKGKQYLEEWPELLYNWILNLN